MSNHRSRRSTSDGRAPSRRSSPRRVLLSLACPLLLFAGLHPLSAAELKPQTINAFDQYIQKAGPRIDGGLQPGSPFLWIDKLPGAERSAAYAQLRSGKVLVYPLAAGLDVPDGMIHDWIGVIFMPGATLDQVLAQIQDYNDYAHIYSPEIIRSSLLDRDGNRFKVSLWLHYKKFVSIDLKVIDDVQYSRIDASHATSSSHSIDIAEIENMGTPQQREVPAGTGHGYLWRMNDYRRFQQAPDGVYVQFELVALTRDIPWGFEWLLKPFVDKLPREALTFTLSRARDSIESSKNMSQQAGD